MSELLLVLGDRDAEEAVRSAQGASGASGLVVGPGLLFGPGPAVVSAVAESGPVLVLASLGGDEASVARAARRLAGYGATWVTVYAIGGAAAIAATAGAGLGAVALTLPPGLDDAAVSALKLGSRGKTVSRLAEASAAAGASGIMCDLPDLGVVAQVAPDLERFVSASTAAEATEAIDRGADRLLVDASVLSAMVG